MSLTNDQKLKRDIEKILNKMDEATRMNWKTGTTLSYVRDLLEWDYNWRGFGNSDSFETRVSGLGFDIVEATTKKGFHKSVRVITFK